MGRPPSNSWAKAGQADGRLVFDGNADLQDMVKSGPPRPHAGTAVARSRSRLGELGVQGRHGRFLAGENDRDRLIDTAS